MSLIRRISLSKDNGVQVGLASTYVGGVDDIWADDVNFNLLRRGDGVTPGGIVMGGTGSGASGDHFSGDYADLTNKPISVSDYGTLPESVLEISDYGTITESAGITITPISLSTLKSITALSTSFADFQSRIAAM